ncbi:MAG: DUF1048 domain-containing protein [Clostridiales bacterium]|jgi:DNA-binding ferritin-like protein (Dps family)|nr:DUF1048 domain-containing protein [Clostridiales bacterium]
MKIFDKIIGVMSEKKCYRDYLKRLDALPKDYNIVLTEMQAYLWSASGVLDGALELLMDVLSMFEAAAADGKRVLDVTGDDVMAFCDDLIREWKSRTWQGDMRAKFNDRIHKQLKGLEGKI